MPNLTNIAIFEDTVSMCENNPRLAENIKSSRKGEIFVSERDSIPDGSNIARFENENNYLQKTHF